MTCDTKCNVSGEPATWAAAGRGAGFDTDASGLACACANAVAVHHAIRPAATERPRRMVTVRVEKGECDKVSLLVGMQN